MIIKKACERQSLQAFAKQNERKLMLNYDPDCYDWYLEFHCNVAGRTRVGTGLFFKCVHRDLTKRVFEHVKEWHEIGNEFYVVLRREDETAEIHDEFLTTRKQFEAMTGLKALTDEEYWKNCETVPFYGDDNAEVNIIRFSSKK